MDPNKLLRYISFCDRLPVIRFQILARTETEGGPEGPLFLEMRIIYEALKALYNYGFLEFGIQEISATWTLADKEELTPSEKLGMKIVNTFTADMRKNNKKRCKPHVLELTAPILAFQEGLEPPALALEGRCSIH